MTRFIRFGKLRTGLLVLGTMAAVTVPAGAASATDDHEGATRFHVTNLVSDVPGRAQLTDPNLANAWGLAAGPTTPIWVANNHTDTSTLYSGAVGGLPVTAVPLVVNVTEPTGLVFNGGNDFVVSAGGASAPARFIFSSESGDITGWNIGVPPPTPSTQAQPAAHVDGAVYKGLAIASTTGGSRLYAANFHAGTVDVFDGTFAPVVKAGAFTDPKLPPGYAPFNVAVINGSVYVTYALQDADAVDDVHGRGHGFIDVFDKDGNFQHRLVSRGRLNSPWGLTVAPQGFGKFGGQLLVGNFGDGRINVYDPTTGRFRGVLRDREEHAISIEGLWALQFGNPTFAGADTLIFSAGPDDETHGLLGIIQVKQARAEEDDG
ncbi:MAG: TIGR03118 family protein [Acidimicrobiales bacterium]